MNTVFQKLPLIEDFLKRAALEESRPLRGVMLVGVQHLLETTGSLMEAFFRMGLDPRDCFLAGKVYSTNSSVVARLRDHWGAHVVSPRRNAAPGSYSLALDGDVRELWSRCLASPRLGQARGVIVLDDGGHAIAAAPTPLVRAIPVVGVEQTSAGLWRCEGSSLPIIEVASSAIKRHLEPTLIWEAVQNRIGLELDRLPHRAVIGVIGAGNIGTVVLNTLAESRSRVLVFDPDPKACLAVHPLVRVCESLEELVRSSDFIFGCSGRDTLAGARDLEAWINGSKTFVSCTSLDTEFRSVLSRAPGPVSPADPLANVLIRMRNGEVTVARSGFPVNFDGTMESVPAQQIQLTRSLLLAGVLQAEAALADGPRLGGERRKLSVRLQDFMARRWFALCPAERGRYPANLFELSSDQFWLDRESGGSPFSGAEITRRFRGWRGRASGGEAPPASISA